MPCPAGPGRAGRETAGGPSGRGGRCCRRAGWVRGRRDPPARPSERHDRDRCDRARQAERPARLPHRPQGQRGRRRAEAARRRPRAAGSGPRGTRRVERGGADRGEEGPPAFDAGDDEDRDVLEVVGLPLAGLDERVVVATGAQEALVDRPALPVGAGELVADVGIAHDDELRTRAAARPSRGGPARAARGWSRRRSGSLRSRRPAVCARMSADDVVERRAQPARRGCAPLDELAPQRAGSCGIRGRR